MSGTTQSLAEVSSAGGGLPISSNPAASNGPHLEQSPSSSQSEPTQTAPHSIESQAPPAGLTNGGEPSSVHQNLRLAKTTDAARAELELTGNVISATFCLPCEVDYASNGDWTLSPRRGNKALIDSFTHLSSPKSSWNHKVVGWTGELHQVPDNGRGSWTTTTGAANIVPVNAGRPMSFRTYVDSSDPGEDDVVNVSLPHRQELEVKLNERFGNHVTPVWLPDAIDDQATYIFRDQEKWRYYGEHELNSLFHYKQNLPSELKITKQAWDSYKRMNTAFADAIVSVYTPGDLVVIHDYQLLLLPTLLRQQIPDISIGFFLHTPFPTSEYFKCLAHRKDLLRGMLGANVIGFQSHTYTEHFQACCKSLLGLDCAKTGVNFYGRHVAFDVFPIGIDAEATLKSAFNAAVDAKVAELRSNPKYQNQKVIVGRDRLESTRGIVQKLQAFEMFLERNPEWHGKVTLVQVTIPPVVKDGNGKTDKTASRVSELITRINGAFGSLTYQPIYHYSQYLPEDDYFALLRIADVALITSVRDGMNTTALEYALCQRENHGTLIISEFSGTADQLEHAVLVNPWDLSGVAKEINKALKQTPTAKEQSHRGLYKRVTENSVQVWIERYLRRLMVELLKARKGFNTSVLNISELKKHYHESTRRLFMFDYDGTLTPIVRDPESAVPSDRVIRNLKALASDRRNAVWIISGRGVKFLEEWMGHISALGLSAEHGSFIRPPNSTKWENLTETFDLEWQKEVSQIFEAYKQTTPGSTFEQKQIALTWHYRSADAETGPKQAKKLRQLLLDTVAKQYDIEIMTGKANVEVRPRSVNKGEIAKRLVIAYGEGDDNAPDFVLCLGDDNTDEDMFRSLRASRLNPDNVFAVVVGANNRSTEARWSLAEPENVIATIAALNED